MWDFKFTEANKPRYLQIADALEADILSGELVSGHRLMTHRDLANAVGVTVSTATRAYAEVEKRGLIKTMVGRGTFVIPAAAATVLDTRIGGDIELGVAMPMALEEPSIKPILQKILNEEDVDSLVKCFAPFGLKRHRELGARWLKSVGSGVNVTADSLLIAAGHQHALYGTFYALFRYGDCIAVDRMTNPALKILALQTGIELVGVKMDDEGMIPDELDALCETKNITGMYITWGVQNPSAKPISRERHEALAEVARRRGLTVIEDYSFFVGEREKASTISSLVPENCIFLASFSGIMYSGLRVAFIHAPQRFYGRLAQTIVETIWTVAPLCVALACESIADGSAERALQLKQREIARRACLVRDIFSGFDVSCSEESIYAWVRLPRYWNSRDFEQAAEKAGVRVFAAEKLAVSGVSAPNYIRLAFTGPRDIVSLKKGLEILVRLLKQESGVINPIW